jgi:hypothetical protein
MKQIVTEKLAGESMRRECLFCYENESDVKLYFLYLFSWSGVRLESIWYVGHYLA